VRSSREACTACGFCCTYLEFRVKNPRNAEGDVFWLESHPGASVEEMPYGPTVRIQTACVHLSEDGKCRVYEERPDICRSFLCVGRENEPTMKEE